jgi:ATP-dependent RNA helicase RhlE
LPACTNSRQTVSGQLFIPLTSHDTLGVLQIRHVSLAMMASERLSWHKERRTFLTSFNDFGFAEPIIRALTQENYLTPTPIQAQTIPVALNRRDVVGIAQTGTGKTAAFALPILQLLAANRQPSQPKSCRVLVLSPTRELSTQILESFRTYGRYLHLKTVLAIGGVPIGRQIRSLANGVDVLVATPGRLLDLVHSRAISLAKIQFLVLDEADRMLDMGFIADVRKIVAMVPFERQTLLFSATMPHAIVELSAQMLRDPVTIAAARVASTAERVQQRVIRVDRPAKAAVLAELLRSEKTDRTLVFTRTKHGADKVVKSLEKAGIAADAIHGNKSQNQRDRVLSAFRRGDVRTLVATDIAARGIDVDGISHVVNFDLPDVAETYVHRIGRTARAGATGIAISLCDSDEVSLVRQIERLIRLTLPMTRHASVAERATRPDGVAALPARERPHHADGRRRPAPRSGGRDRRPVTMVAGRGL